MEKNKKIIMGVAIVAILVLVIGAAYAAYTYSRSGENQELIAGEIYMHYKEEAKQIQITEAMPSKTYDKNQYFEFTIDGKNTNTEKDIYYEIILTHGESVPDKTTALKDEDLRFTLTETKNGKTTTVIRGASYEDLNNHTIWVNTIPNGTNEKIEISYKLYMWVGESATVGNGDASYTFDEWNNSYASIKVAVKGDFLQKEAEVPEPDTVDLISILKEKAYTDTKELIAIDVTDKSNIKKCESVEACAGKTIEYRYSGPEANNYLKLTDNNGAEEDWRIIGIFTDESGEEYLRVVRDSVLSEDYLPVTYTINNAINNGSEKKVTYEIKYEGTDSGYNSFDAYWNRNDSSTYKNRWEESGLQYYLNTAHDDAGEKGYLSYLSENVKDLLEANKLYLGTVSMYSSSSPTAKLAYKYERATECSTGRGTISSSSRFTDSEKCRVWDGNLPTYDKSMVSLMYPSDYGLSASESYWESTSLYSYQGKEASWMYNTMVNASIHSWLLSPSDGDYYSGGRYVTRLYGGGLTSASFNSLGGYVPMDLNSVRPVLNLASLTEWIEGDGQSKSTAYKIF